MNTATTKAHTQTNAGAIEAWNTVLFDKFCRFRHVVTTGLSVHGEAAIERAAPASGQRVLDVGCGFGDTTVTLAARVGQRGEAVGVDAPARFIDLAAREARRAGAANARFVVADVQTGDLGGPFDLAFARFGTMFFDNPVQAMRSVRRALGPGGRLVMTVWRKREDNAWVYTAQQVVEKIVPPPESHDAPTCGPGPFSMASADVVTDVLQKSGFRHVTLERHDAPILIGRDLEDAVEFLLSIGPAGELLRLAGSSAEQHRPAVVAGLREALAPYVGEDGVRAPSSAWIVSAVAAA